MDARKKDWQENSDAVVDAFKHFKYEVHEVIIPDSRNDPNGTNEGARWTLASQWAESYITSYSSSQTARHSLVHAS